MLVEIDGIGLWVLNKRKGERTEEGGRHTIVT